MSKKEKTSPEVEAAPKKKSSKVGNIIFFVVIALIILASIAILVVSNQSRKPVYKTSITVVEDVETSSTTKATTKAVSTKEGETTETHKFAMPSLNGGNNLEDAYGNLFGGTQQWFQ